MAPNTRPGKLVKVVLLEMVLSAVALISFDRKTPAAQTTEHPYIAPDDIKSETCLTCHPDKKESKSVHTAVRMGCENCHRASSQGQKKTTITLIAEGGKLCATCHEASKDPVQHGPYKTGQCLVCHEPHSSNFPKQTRAETNILCSSCHAARQPDVRVNADGKTVSLLGGRTFDLGTYEKAPRIEPGHAKQNSVFAVRHPLAASDSRKRDAELGCLDCHTAHSGKAEHLLHGAMGSRSADENSLLNDRVETRFIGGPQ